MRRDTVWLAFCAVLAACTAPKRPLVASPFDYVGQDWTRFSASVNGVSTRLILDTGGGVTLLSKQLCDRVGCVPDGTFTGKRMSGQSITLPMARVRSLVLAGHEVKNARVAVLDLATLLHPELGVEGFAGLDVLRDQAFTIDHAHKTLTIEDASSLANRREKGQVVKIRVEDDGPSTVIYMPLQIAADIPPLEMEVDSGSRDLILDERFMQPLGIAQDAPNVKRVDGKDETNNAYARFFSTMPRDAQVPGTKRVGVHAGDTVMFQKIIHDGLVGHTFLSSYVITYDLPNAQMIFAPR